MLKLAMDRAIQGRPGDRFVKRKWWVIAPPIPLYQFKDGDVVCADALKLLSSLREGVADIVFLDPPFNLGKRYGSLAKLTDQMEDGEYFEYLRKVIERASQVLKPGGALYLYHVPKWAFQFASVLHQSLAFRHWIAISMKNGFVRGNRLYPAHYALLYFTKGAPLTFRRPKIPIPTCRHCRKPIKDYGGYKEFVRDGINLSDIWEDISPVRHEKYKHRESNELPQKVLDRVLTISGKRGGLLVDPFAGSGTALVSARKHGLRFIGGDSVKASWQLMTRRLMREVGASA